MKTKRTPRPNAFFQVPEGAEVKVHWNGLGETGMNERIKTLMAQAGFDPAAIERMGVLPYAEKFAELIVKECIGCCEQVISDPIPESVDTWLNGGSQCINEIKEHFGVE